MKKPLSFWLSAALGTLIVGVGIRDYMRTTRFLRAEKAFVAVGVPFRETTQWIIECYRFCESPEEVARMNREFLVDGTFNYLDSLHEVQQEQMRQMIAACPERYTGRLTTNVGEYLDRVRLNDVANIPFLYRIFPPVGLDFLSSDLEVLR